MIAWNQSAAFYLMPARFWEICLGIYAFKVRNPFAERQIFAIISFGLLAYLYAFPQINEIYLVPFTALFTAVTIIGTQKTSKLREYLTHPILEFIGKRSYGIYLWHWPLLVFCKNIWQNQPILNILLPITCTMIIASLSYTFVETPLRVKKWGFSQGLKALLVYLHLWDLYCWVQKVLPKIQL